MPNIFTRPHPYYDDKKAVLLRCLIIGFCVAFILIVFQPFGTEKFEHPYKKLYLAGHGLISFLAFSSTLLGLPLLFPKYLKEENWVVWKHILVFGTGFLLTFSGSYFYMNWFFCLKFDLSTFLNFFSIVAVIGLIPMTIITLLDNTRQQKRN